MSSTETWQVFQGDQISETMAQLLQHMFQVNPSKRASFSQVQKSLSLFY